MQEHSRTSTDGLEGMGQGTSEQGKEEEKSETVIQAQDETVLPKVSQRKIEANRRNAQKSTGPKTPRGKAAVRFNALKHGLLAEQILLAASEEERSLIERVLKGVYDHFQPAGYLETHCVEELAVCLLKKTPGTPMGNISAAASPTFDFVCKQRTSRQRKSKIEAIARASPGQ